MNEQQTKPHVHVNFDWRGNRADRPCEICGIPQAAHDDPRKEMTEAEVIAEANRRAERAGLAGEILGTVNVHKVGHYGDAIRCEWTDCCGRWHHSTIKMAKLAKGVR
jgi:hypothetical protein